MKRCVAFCRAAVAAVVKVAAFSVIAVVAVVAVVAGARPAAAESADPFYLDLLRDGKTATARGDFAGAERTLRIACFGLLDQPPLLSECMVRLALAQASAGHQSDFVQTFDRVVAIEQRFPVYRESALSADDRRQFEEKALAWTPIDTLRASPAFAGLAAHKEEQELAKLPARERRKELERRLALQPAEARWRLLLAEEDLAEKRAQSAFDRLGAIPGDALDGRVACARALALAALTRCAEALPSFAVCPSTERDERYAAPALDCHLALKKLDEGKRLAARLAPELAAKPEIKKRIAALSAPVETKTAQKANSVALASNKAKTPPAIPPKPGPPAISKGATVAAPSPAPSGKPSNPAASPKPEAAVAKTKPATSKIEAAPPKPLASRSEAMKPEAAKPEAAKADPAAAKADSVAVRTLTADEKASAEEARRTLVRATSQADLGRAYAIAKPLADVHPNERELQFLAAEIAYRSTKWSECAAYFRRGGDPEKADPLLRFYMAVCLYETGDRAGARSILEGSQDRLKRTPYVEGYLRKIFAPADGVLP